MTETVPNIYQNANEGLSDIYDTYVRYIMHL